MPGRTQYTKYHDKMKYLIKDCLQVNYGLIEDSVFVDFENYFLKTIKKDTSFKLYRYVSLYYKDEFSLNLEELRCSNNGSLNDIFEGLPQDWSNLHTAEEYLKAIQNHAWVKCFSESPKINLMWAHYADSFKGICIEYDVCKLTDVNIQKQLFPVYYTKERKFFLDTDSLIEYYNGDKIDQTESWRFTKDTKGVFLQKASYWKYEQEWRLCIINEDKSAEKNIPFACVSAVYLGPRISNSDLRCVVDLVRDYERNNQCHVDIYKTMLNKKDFTLNVIKDNTLKEDDLWQF